jgi:hypothetical protein
VVAKRKIPKVAIQTSPASAAKPTSLASSASSLVSGASELLTQTTPSSSLSSNNNHAPVTSKSPPHKEDFWKPAIIMKLDVEGSELEVMEDLILTGGLAPINRTLVEWHEVCTHGALT